MALRCGRQNRRQNQETRKFSKTFIRKISNKGWVSALASSRTVETKLKPTTFWFTLGIPGRGIGEALNGSPSDRIGSNYTPTSKHLRGENSRVITLMWSQYKYNYDGPILFMIVSTLREFKIAFRRKRRRLGGAGGNPKGPQTGQQKLPPVQVKGSQGRVIRRRPSTSVPPRLTNQTQLTI